MKYYYLYQEVEDLSVFQFINEIRNSHKLKLGEAKLTDFIINGQSHIGVYVLFDTLNVPAYVGKTASRTILERIAGHMDLRHWAFMNSFLSALAGKKKSRKLPRATNIELENAYQLSLEFSIVFVSVPDKEKISRLEGIMSRELQPYLNSINAKMAYAASDIIRNI